MGGYIIDDTGARRKRGAGHGGFHGINGNGDIDAPGQLFDDGQNPTQLLRFGHRFGARPRGFTAHVENLRAVGDEIQRVGHGGPGIQKFSAIGKRVGRDIDHAHDQRRARKHKFKWRARKMILWTADRAIVSGFQTDPQS